MSTEGPSPRIAELIGAIADRLLAELDDLSMDMNLAALGVAPALGAERGRHPERREVHVHGEVVELGQQPVGDGADELSDAGRRTLRRHRHGVCHRTSIEIKSVPMDIRAGLSHAYLRLLHEHETRRA